MNYPEADRYIPATPALLEGWCGPVERMVGISVIESWSNMNHGDLRVRLDPLHPEVRDHLIRRLSLPGWMRDGAGLEPWQSAGLIACAAAGVRPKGLYVRKPNLYIGGDRMEIVAGGVYDTDNTTTDVALAHGCALMLDADTMILPWPGSPRIWRRA